NLLFYYRYALRDVPIGFRLCDAEDEVPENFLSTVGMNHFRMELDAVDFPLRVTHGGNTAGFGIADECEPVRQLRNAVAMTHPDLERRLDAIPKRVIGNKLQPRDTVLTAIALFNTASKMMCDQLMTVADAEYRQPAVQDRGIDIGTAGLIDTTGASGNDKSAAAFELP